MDRKRGIVIVAGDPSGDLYGSMLVRELRALGDFRFDVVGGTLMRRELAPGDGFLADLASHGIAGFVEPVRRIPALLGLLSRLKVRLERRKPAAVVCIDFYGFNRYVLGAAKAAGVPTFYFISPQVWASRPGRVNVLRRTVDRMLVIFPFEEKLYRDAGVPVDWVGHPLLDILPPPRSPAERPTGSPLRLGLLPGSRPGEVRRHLPVFLQAAARILKDFPRTEGTLFAAAAIPDEVYRLWTGRWRGPDGGRIRQVREAAYAERSRQDLVLTSSGTATLENALLGLPMVVVYKLSWPTYFLARALIRVRHIAMANILAGRGLVPELIQGDATPERIARSALELLGDPRRLRALRRDLTALREQLGGPGAVRRAARIIQEGA